MKKIAVSGGAPVPLADAASPYQPSWSADDRIVYYQMGKGIVRISASGGVPETIIKEVKPLQASPRILPDGKSVLYNSADGKAVVQSLKSGQAKELFAADFPQYLPTGHIVYEIGNDLFAVPFDPDRLEVSGGQVPLVNGVMPLQYAVSDSGTLIYLPATASAAPPAQRTLVWVDRKGKEEPLAVPSNNYHGFRLSPDGKSIALAIQANNKNDIWTLDLVRSTLTRLTLDESDNSVPLWAPGGKRIAFSSDRKDSPGGIIYWKAADGTGKEQLLSSAPDRSMHPASWSADGKILITLEYFMSGTNWDIGAVSMEGDRKRKPLLNEKYNEIHPQISPDGNWMAYVSDESGRNEIYVRPFPEVDKGRKQVSTSGGDTPLWSRDGRELFYRNGDSVMAVSVKKDPAFSLDVPKILFRGSYVSLTSGDDSSWDISPDGKRFLMMKEPKPAVAAGEGPRRIKIVLNWFEELKQRVPKK